jgi:hypothetical protein
VRNEKLARKRGEREREIERGERGERKGKGEER